MVAMPAPVPHAEPPPGPTGRRGVVLAAPDAYKGTADATVLSAAIAAGAEEEGWAADRCPLSDGGEGFADVLAAARPGGSWHTTPVTGPLGAPVEARWWMADDEAVVESAAASGLPLAGGAEGNDPLRATTRGTGELVMAARRAGARRVLLGVGGSATTDGGRGAVEAIEEAGGLGDTEVVVACDVRVRFLAAARAFGPQKGADASQVVELERRLESYADRLRERYGVDVLDLAGAGAAGGLGGGLAALGARLVPGFEVVAGAVGLERRLAEADVVVTGEGRLDATSWDGKVVGAVVEAAARLGVAVLVVVGSTGPGGIDGARQAAASVSWVDLSARHGRARAQADPAQCMREAVAEALRSLPSPGRAGS